MTTTYIGRHRAPKRTPFRITRADLYTVLLSATAFLTLGFAWLARI